MSQKKSRLSASYNQPLWLVVTHKLLKLPRLARIVIVALFALATTLVLSPLVDFLYLTYMYTDESRIFPSLVSAGVGLLAYLVGWWLFVGGVDQSPPARRMLLLYVMGGILILCLVIVLTLAGFSTANAPTI
jgi:hypothetical protein